MWENQWKKEVACKKIDKMDKLVARKKKKQMINIRNKTGHLGYHCRYYRYKEDNKRMIWTALHR